MRSCTGSGTALELNDSRRLAQPIVTRGVMERRSGGRGISQRKA
jgi:hypothetical protein